MSLFNIHLSMTPQISVKNLFLYEIEFAKLIIRYPHDVALGVRYDFPTTRAL